MLLEIIMANGILWVSLSEAKDGGIILNRND